MVAAQHSALASQEVIPLSPTAGDNWTTSLHKIPQEVYASAKRSVKPKLH
jgi:hypothetical protein